MTTPSPDFKINGGAVGVKAPVTAGSTVTCTLNDTSGVKTVTWSIIRTDDTTTIAQWDTTFVQSGAVGETLEFTALTAGTACIVQAQINNGLINGIPDSASRATAKVYIDTAEGMEVLTDDELVNTALESSATHGAVVPLNAIIRAVGTPLGDYKPSVKVVTTAALAAYTRVGSVITADGNGALGNIDGEAMAATDTFLFNHGAAGADNGVWEVTDAGDGASPFVLTRVWWMDESVELTAGAMVPVEKGSVNADTLWVCTTDGTITINTTATAWSRLAAGVMPLAAPTTDNAVMRWHSTTGYVAQNSTATLSDAGHLVTTSIALGGTAASSGDIRLDDTAEINFWGPSGDVGGLAKNSSDWVTLGGDNVVKVVLSADGVSGDKLTGDTSGNWIWHYGVANTLTLGPDNQGVADTAGRAVLFRGAAGGPASAVGGGQGSDVTVSAGTGGGGTGGLNPGAGGELLLTAGAGGQGGTGNSAGGHAKLRAAVGWGTGNNGNVYIGDSGTVQTIIGPSVAHGGTVLSVLEQGDLIIQASHDLTTFSANASPIAYVAPGGFGIGTNTVPHGGVGLAQLAIDGTDPHIQITHSTEDNHPVMQIRCESHDSCGIYLDSYYDGVNTKSSDPGSNFRMYKAGDVFYMSYDSAVAAGNAVSWNTGLSLDTAGIVSIWEKLGIGTTDVPVGGIGDARVAIDGTNAAAAGPHVHFTASGGGGDSYPIINIWPWTHDSCAIWFDAYYESGSGTKSSDSGSNFGVQKSGNELLLRYDSGNAQGAAVTWNTGLSLDTAGLVTIPVQANIAKLGIGTATVPHGGVGYAMLALEGTTTSADGPHIQLTASADDYPLCQILGWSHDNIAIYFDAYFDGANKSSDPTSNFLINKESDLLKLSYDGPVAQGNAITWNTGLSLDTAGLVTIPGSLAMAAANVATIGDIRTAANTNIIVARNQANDGDIPVIGMDNSDSILVGRNDADLDDIYLRVPTGQSIFSEVAGAAELTVTDNLVTISTALAVGGTVASAGDVRGDDTFTLKAWGTGPVNINMLVKDAADFLYLGGSDGADDRPAQIEIDPTGDTAISRAGSGHTLFENNSIRMFVATLQWDDGEASPMLTQQLDSSAGATGDDLTVEAQGVADPAGGATSGDLGLRGGRGTVHANNTDGNVWFHEAPANWQSMEEGIFVSDAVTNPTGNPAAGGFLYSNGGAGTWRGSGGTTTAFGPAGSHCGSCGYDFWKVHAVNERWGARLLVCGWCGAEYREGPASVLAMLTEQQRSELVK